MLLNSGKQELDEMLDLDSPIAEREEQQRGDSKYDNLFE
jgi:hypothetical protein